MRDRLGLLLAGAVSALFAALLLPAWLLGGLVWFLNTGSPAAGIVLLEAGLLCAYLLWWRVLASRAFKISPFYALTLPLGALIFTAMMFASAYNVSSGRGVEWKGRRYR
jgi:hypothetical protein